PGLVSGDGYMDIFINTSPYTWPSSTRFAKCSSTNTWTYIANGGNGQQISAQSLAAIKATLEAKISYAITRWGASFFYVDSAVYDGGGPYNYTLWRDLAAEYPTINFFPEE